MKNSPLYFTLLAALFTTTLAARAAETNVPCSSLPAAVQAEGSSMLDGATLHNCVKDVSKTGTTYEMELIKDGRSRDISFDVSGNVLEIEAQVELDAVPAPVKQSMQAAATGGKIGKIESLTKNGQIVSYETTISKGGKRHEIAFRPDGSSVKPD